MDVKKSKRTPKKREKPIHPMTADGVRIKKGTILYCIVTKDAGKTWRCYEPLKVAKTTRYGMYAFDDPPIAWHWPSAGDNRAFSTLKAAKAECAKRNKGAKRRFRPA